jgi:hypothetical protein
MAKQYKYNAGSRLPVPAQVAGEELERIAATNDGIILPSTVVEESKPESAPLHDCFEWQDEIAAEKYRLDQARQIIRTVVVTEHEGREIEPTRAFVNIITAEQQGYMATGAALSDESLREQVLSRARSEMATWADRYRHLSELASVVAEVDRALVLA